jgi:serine/threonine protein kinase
MTDADRWARVGALFAAALEKSPAERDALIRTADEPLEVQNEVRSLLAAHEDAGEFLAPPAPSPPAAPGTLIGPYRVVRIIGQGGMGIVYQAEDTRLQRPVALKLLSPAQIGNEMQRERLKLEARAAAALTHPGIATVYALEEFEGQIVMVTEYLEGQTLREEMASGRLPVDRALAAALEIARAMAAAHERGIVHRDLKPENILRTKSGVLKVLDFGLAKFDGAARELISKTLTEAGLVAGTPPYMAPEQLLGRATDFRTDHFAFGVVLYEITTGRHPFGGQSLPSTIAHILAGEPRVPLTDEGLPAALWEFICRCLQKDPAARYASTPELVDQLELLRSATSTPSTQEKVIAQSTPITRSAPSTSGIAGTSGTSGGDAFWWWKFHQIAAAVVYWAMIWPVWHVHRSVGRAGLFLFFATLAAVVIAANLRIHLWFSSRVYPEQLDEQRADTGRWIRSADLAFVALLVTGGLLLPDSMAGWAAVLISVGIGVAVASLIIEPGTTRAAFRKP